MPKKKMETQIVLCGRGGQGVLFLTRLLDEVALSRGSHVISSETHGMAMRGGSVVSYIKIGNFNSPLIRAGQADILLALSESEVSLNRHLLKQGSGQIYCNTPCPWSRLYRCHCHCTGSWFGSCYQPCTAGICLRTSRVPL